MSELGKSQDRNELEKTFQQLRLEINPSLKNYEHLKKMIIVREDWTIENECLTPTMKIKRPSIEKKYQESFESWYASDLTVIYE